MTQLHELHKAMQRGALLLQQASEHGPDLLTAEDRSRLGHLINRSEADRTRRSLRIGLLPLAGIDPGKLSAALLRARLLPPTHGRSAGPRVRVRNSDVADLRATGAQGAPWTWSDANPDPRPTLQAKATALHAERQALSEEDHSLAKAVANSEQRVVRFQQDVMGLSASVNEGRSQCSRTAAIVSMAEKHHQHCQDALNKELDGLPAALRTPGGTGLRGLTASVLSGFHTEALARVQARRAALVTADAQLQAAREGAADAQACLVSAEQRLQAHNQQLSRLRSQLHLSQERRDRLRQRAGQLTRARVGLAHSLDKVAGLRRKAFRRSVAEQCMQGAQRLWLDWPTPNLPPQTTLLLADLVSSPDPQERRAADAWLADRSDVLLVAVDLGRPLAPPEQDRLRRLLRDVPMLLPVLTGLERVQTMAERRGDIDPDEAVEDARAAAVRRLALDLGLATAPRAVGLPLVALLDKRRPKASRDQLAEEFTRELTRLLQALRDGPRIARPARLARAMHAAARILEAGMARQDAEEHTRREGITAQQLADPQAFRAHARRAAAHCGTTVAAVALELTQAKVEERLATRFAAHFAAVDAADFRELRRLQSQLPKALETGLPDDLRAIEEALVESIEQAQTELIASILGPLADRVRAAVHITFPGTMPTTATAPDLARDMTALLRAQAPDPARPELRMALIGGAIGAVLSGGLAAPVLLALGAGALATRVGGDPEPLRKELRQYLTEARATVQRETTRWIESRRGELERLAPHTAQAEIVASIDRFEQWMAELVDAERQRHDTLLLAREEVRGLRDALLEHAEQLEGILHETRSPGVAWRPPWSTQLPPPPAPVNDT